MKRTHHLPDCPNRGDKWYAAHADGECDSCEQAEEEVSTRDNLRDIARAIGKEVSEDELTEHCQKVNFRLN